MDRVLPIPAHYVPRRVGEVFRVPYQQRAAEAEAWALAQDIAPAAEDARRIGLLLVDVQNTFCLPEHELFVAGRSGLGAVEDNRRLCEFIYRNLGAISQMVLTLDTHRAMQIFHPVYLVDAQGRHPEPFTEVSVDDVEQGRWRFNPAAAASLGIDAQSGQRHLLAYVRALAEGGKYALTVWPYHSMLGGIGHALVAAVEEAVFFHALARASQPEFRVKGGNAFSEHYSVLGPEVTRGPGGEGIEGKDPAFIERLIAFDALIVAGQAKSHCVAWTVADLLREIEARDRAAALRVYLLEDCTSPVVVPGVVDYTDAADAAYRRFADAGMHLVRSTEPIAQWPGMRG